MKHIYILSLALIGSVFFLGACDEDPILYDAGSYVAFENGASSVSEDGEVASIRFYRSSTDMGQPLTVKFSYKGVYTQKTEFHESGDDASATFGSLTDVSSVTIPAGRAYGSIVLKIINDAEAAGPKSVTINITGVSTGSYNIGFPGPDKNRSVHTLTIKDDE